jgi:hypothetical protein
MNRFKFQEDFDYFTSLTICMNGLLQGILPRELIRKLFSKPSMNRIYDPLFNTSTKFPLALLTGIKQALSSMGGLLLPSELPLLS